MVLPPKNKVYKTHSLYMDFRVYWVLKGAYFYWKNRFRSDLEKLNDSVLEKRAEFSETQCMKFSNPKYEESSKV